MTNKPFKQFAAIFLTGFYFSTHVLLAHAVENNFWKERQEKTIQLALAFPEKLPMPSLLNTRPISASINFNSARKKTPTHSAPLQSLIDAISSNSGSVKEIFDKPNSTASPVLLIQDIHLNPEAQTNIAALLQNLIDQNQVTTVGVEGAFGEFDFTPGRFYSDKKMVRDVAGDFLKKNLISASSYVGLTSIQNPPLFVGVDDKAHHKANVEAYLSTRNLVGKVLSQIKKSQEEIETAKRKELNASLKKFDLLYMAHAKGTMGLGEYIKKMELGHWAQHVAPLQIETFLSAYDLENKINFSQVEKERACVIESLSRVLSEKETTDLMNESVDYKSGAINFGTYYQDLKSVCEAKKIDLRLTPTFDNYIRYVLLSDGINTEQLFKEVHQLEEQVMAKLILNSREKELMDLSQHLILSEKLVNFSMTAEEWIEYKTLVYSPWTIDHRPNLSLFERFYEEADIRSQLMLQNLLTAAPNSGKKVLVAGGYHTSYLTQLLKEKNISFVVVSPKITKVETNSGNAYLSAFAQEKTALDKLFEGEKLFVCPPGIHAFSAGAVIRTEEVENVLAANAALLHQKVLPGFTVTLDNGNQPTVTGPDGVKHPMAPSDEENNPLQFGKVKFLTNSKNFLGLCFSLLRRLIPKPTSEPTKSVQDPRITHGVVNTAIFKTIQFGKAISVLGSDLKGLNLKIEFYGPENNMLVEKLVANFWYTNENKKDSAFNELKNQFKDPSFRKRQYDSLLLLQKLIALDPSLEEFRFVVLFGDNELFSINDVDDFDNQMPILAHTGQGESTYHKLDRKTIFLPSQNFVAGRFNFRGFRMLVNHEKMDSIDGFHQWRGGEEAVIREFWNEVRVCQLLAMTRYESGKKMDDQDREQLFKKAINVSGETVISLKAYLELMHFYRTSKKIKECNETMKLMGEKIKSLLKKYEEDSDALHMVNKFERLMHFEEAESWIDQKNTALVYDFLADNPKEKYFQVKNLYSDNAGDYARAHFILVRALGMDQRVDEALALIKDPNSPNLVPKNLFRQNESDWSFAWLNISISLTRLDRFSEALNALLEDPLNNPLKLKDPFKRKDKYSLLESIYGKSGQPYLALAACRLGLNEFSHMSDLERWRYEIRDKLRLHGNYRFSWETKVNQVFIGLADNTHASLSKSLEILKTCKPEENFEGVLVKDRIAYTQKLIDQSKTPSSPNNPSPLRLNPAAIAVSLLWAPMGILAEWVAHVSGISATTKQDQGKSLGQIKEALLKAHRDKVERAEVKFDGQTFTYYLLVDPEFKNRRDYSEIFFSEFKTTLVHNILELSETSQKQFLSQFSSPEHPFVLACLDQSEFAMVDHQANGIIGINKHVFDDTGELAQKWLQGLAKSSSVWNRLALRFIPLIMAKTLFLNMALWHEIRHEMLIYEMEILLEENLITKNAQFDEVFQAWKKAMEGPDAKKLMNRVEEYQVERDRDILEAILSKFKRDKKVKKIVDGAFFAHLSKVEKKDGENKYLVPPAFMNQKSIKEICRISTSLLNGELKPEVAKFQLRQMGLPLAWINQAIIYFNKFAQAEISDHAMNFERVQLAMLAQEEGGNLSAEHMLWRELHLVRPQMARAFAGIEDFSEVKREPQTANGKLLKEKMMAVARQLGINVLFVGLINNLFADQYAKKNLGSSSVLTIWRGESMHEWTGRLAMTLQNESSPAPINSLFKKDRNLIPLYLMLLDHSHPVVQESAFYFLLMDLLKGYMEKLVRSVKWNLNEDEVDNSLRPNKLLRAILWGTINLGWESFYQQWRGFIFYDFGNQIFFNDIRLMFKDFEKYIQHDREFLFAWQRVEDFKNRTQVGPDNRHEYEAHLVPMRLRHWTTHEAVGYLLWIAESSNHHARKTTRVMVNSLRKDFDRSCGFVKEQYFLFLVDVKTVLSFRGVPLGKSLDKKIIETHNYFESKLPKPGDDLFKRGFAVHMSANFLSLAVGVLVSGVVLIFHFHPVHVPLLFNETAWTWIGMGVVVGIFASHFSSSQMKPFSLKARALDSVIPHPVKFSVSDSLENRLRAAFTDNNSGEHFALLSSDDKTALAQAREFVGAVEKITSELSLVSHHDVFLVLPSKNEKLQQKLEGTILGRVQIHVVVGGNVWDVINEADKMNGETKPSLSRPHNFYFSDENTHQNFFDLSQVPAGDRTELEGSFRYYVLSKVKNILLAIRIQRQTLPRLKEFLKQLTYA